ncbi:unannotated protein [freshwater metagenome]|uniref:Unannotated protein n=1 Tax=freshwater metagenome TaxID=449393 RepID=A0A6J7GZN1_9ZZZZ
MVTLTPPGAFFGRRGAEPVDADAAPADLPATSVAGTDFGAALDVEAVTDVEVGLVFETATGSEAATGFDTGAADAVFFAGMRLAGAGGVAGLRVMRSSSAS